MNATLIFIEPEVSDDANLPHSWLLYRRIPRTSALSSSRPSSNSRTRLFRKKKIKYLAHQLACVKSIHLHHRSIFTECGQGRQIDSPFTKFSCFTLVRIPENIVRVAGIECRNKRRIYTSINFVREQWLNLLTLICL